MSPDLQRVFIGSNGGHDYSEAKKYGDLIFCIPSNIVVHKNNISALYRHIYSTLSNYAYEDSYILVAGPPSEVAIMASIMALWFGRVNFLIYENDTYRERSIVIDDGDPIPDMAEVRND